MLSPFPDTPAVVDALLEHDFDPVAAASTLGLRPTELIQWYRDPAARQALADIEDFQLQLARLQALKFRRSAAAELASLFTDTDATRPQRLRAAIALLRPDRATLTARAREPEPPPAATDQPRDHAPIRPRRAFRPAAAPPIAPSPAPATPEPAPTTASAAPDPRTLDPHAAYLERLRAIQHTGEPPELEFTSHSDTQTQAACSPTQSDRSPPA